MRSLDQQRVVHAVVCCIASLAMIATSGCEDTPTDARPQWSRISIATTADLVAVDMRANGSGTIVGDSSTIFATSDKGKTWTKQTCLVSGDFTAVRELANGDAVAATAQGVVVMRRAGTWSAVAYSPSALRLDAIAIMGKAIYVVGGAFQGNLAVPVIVRSQDSGRNWEAVPSLMGRLYMWIKDLAFVADNRMLLVGKCIPPGICTSNLEALNTTSESVEHRGLAAFGALEDIAITTTGVGLLVGSSVSRSDDTGKSWTLQRKQLSSPFAAVDLDESGFGLLVGTGGATEATFDGGLIWHKQPASTTRNLNDASIGDASFAIVVGDGGTVVRWGN